MRNQEKSNAKHTEKIGKANRQPHTDTDSKSSVHVWGVGPVYWARCRQTSVMWCTERYMHSSAGLNFIFDVCVRWISEMNLCRNSAGFSLFCFHRDFQDQTLFIFCSVYTYVSLCTVYTREGWRSMPLFDSYITDIETVSGHVACVRTIWLLGHIKHHIEENVLIIKSSHQ